MFDHDGHFEKSRGNLGVRFVLQLVSRTGKVFPQDMVTKGLFLFNGHISDMILLQYKWLHIQTDHLQCYVTLMFIIAFQMWQACKYSSEFTVDKPSALWLSAAEWGVLTLCIPVLQGYPCEDEQAIVSSLLLNYSEAGWYSPAVWLWKNKIVPQGLMSGYKAW